jgi:hypothetical protein
MGLDQSIIRLHGDEREEVAYFRKVNFLHLWVETNLFDGQSSNCDDIPLSLEAMAGLMKTCYRVLDNPSSIGPELLPTTAGFFFGGTEYDEWYAQDVQDVLTALVKILAEEAVRHEAGERPGQYVYWSWW